MQRFVLGFLAGVLATCLYGSHTAALVRAAVGWLEHTAMSYSSPSEGTEPAESSPR